MHVLTETFVALLFLIFDYGVFATQTLRGSIGSTVRISCDVNIPETSIFWRHQRSLGARDQYVVIRNVVMPAYKDRYTLTVVPPPGYVLTIRNLAVDDAGSYTCIEEDGLGDRHYSKLEVHGSELFSHVLLEQGQKAMLPCQGTFVRWVMQKPNSDEVQIYGETGVAEEYKLRFYVSRSEIHGDFMMTIHTVDASDSGNYTCIDSTGVESRHTYNLTVSPKGKDDSSPPQSHAAVGSLSLTGIIVIVTVVPTVIVIFGLIIGIVLVPRARKQYRARERKIAQDKEQHKEKILLLARSSPDYDILKMKFEYLHGELAKLDLTDVISNLAGKGFIEYKERTKLAAIKNPVEKCNEMLQILNANKNREAFYQLRLSMAQSRNCNCEDFILHMDELVFDDKEVVDLHSKASIEKKIVLKCDDDIHGITVLNNELFVLHIGAMSDVVVYSTQTYSLLYPIVVKDMKAPADITSCKTNNCLYISDRISNSIHRVQLQVPEVNTQARKHGSQTSWSVGETPRGLSVTSKSSLLVCCVSVNVLKEFSTNGKFIREIELPSNLPSVPAVVQPSNQTKEQPASAESSDGGALPVGRTEAAGSDEKHQAGSSASATETVSNDVKNYYKVDSPWHAIELGDNRFVVCHGKGEPNCNHRVCIINAIGDVLYSYGGNRGPAVIGELDGPGHLALDKDGFIFVADLFNSRVLLLSPTLKYAREIMSPMQVRCSMPLGCAPNRLYLDKDNRRLFVADSKLIFVAHV